MNKTLGFATYIVYGLKKNDNVVRKWIVCASNPDHAITVTTRNYRPAMILCLKHKSGPTSPVGN